MFMDDEMPVAGQESTQPPPPPEKAMTKSGAGGNIKGPKRARKVYKI